MTPEHLLQILCLLADLRSQVVAQQEVINSQAAEIQRLNEENDPDS